MRLSLIAASILISAGSAHASGTISCVGEQDVAVALTIGSLPVLSVVSANISTPGGTLAIGAEAADNAIVPGQAFREDGRLMIDFTDPNIERVVVELRLFEALEGHEYAMAGTLRVPGEGAYALTCAGP